MRVVGATILGVFFGALMGIGLYEILVQNGSFDPAAKVGLVFPIVGVLIGGIAGMFGGRRPKTTIVAPPGSTVTSV